MAETIREKREIGHLLTDDFYEDIITEKDENCIAYNELSDRYERLLLCPTCGNEGFKHELLEDGDLCCIEYVEEITCSQ